MKNSIRSVFFCLAAICSLHVLHAQAFEGVITLEAENTEAGEKSRITWYIRGDQQRMDYAMTTAQGSVNMQLYMQPNSGSLTVVSDGNKIVVDAATMQISPYLENILVINPRQETRDVAGYSGKLYTAKGTTGSVDLYITEQLTLSMPPVFSVKGIWKALQENSIKGVPLDITAKNTQGAVVFTQRVISVERREVKDSEVNL